MEIIPNSLYLGSEADYLRFAQNEKTFDRLISLGDFEFLGDFHLIINLPDSNLLGYFPIIWAFFSSPHPTLNYNQSPCNSTSKMNDDASSLSLPSLHVNGTLVHCVHGQSRSYSVVLFILMKIATMESNNIDHFQHSSSSSSSSSSIDLLHHVWDIVSSSCERSCSIIESQHQPCINPGFCIQLQLMALVFVEMKEKHVKILELFVSDMMMNLIDGEEDDDIRSFYPIFKIYEEEDWDHNNHVVQASFSLCYVDLMLKEMLTIKTGCYSTSRLCCDDNSVEEFEGSLDEVVWCRECKFPLLIHTLSPFSYQVDGGGEYELIWMIGDIWRGYIDYSSFVTLEELVDIHHFINEKEDEEEDVEIVIAHPYHHLLTKSIIMLMELSVLHHDIIGESVSTSCDEDDGYDDYSGEIQRVGGLFPFISLPVIHSPRLLSHSSQHHQTLNITGDNSFKEGGMILKDAYSLVKYLHFLDHILLSPIDPHSISKSGRDELPRPHDVSLQYGEIDGISFANLMCGDKMTRLLNSSEDCDEDDILEKGIRYIDLGSGLGKSLFVIMGCCNNDNINLYSQRRRRRNYLPFQLKECVGIEIIPTLCCKSQELLVQVTQYLEKEITISSQNHKEEEEEDAVDDDDQRVVSIKNMDIFDFHLTSSTSSSSSIVTSIVFISSLLFSPNLKLKVEEKCKCELKEGDVIITLHCPSLEYSSSNDCSSFIRNGQISQNLEICLQFSEPLVMKWGKCMVYVSKMKKKNNHDK